MVHPPARRSAGPVGGTGSTAAEPQDDTPRPACSALDGSQLIGDALRAIASIHGILDPLELAVRLQAGPAPPLLGRVRHTGGEKGELDTCRAGTMYSAVRGARWA